MTDAQADRQQHAEQGVHPRVLVFYDYACQFCYLDWPRFKRLRAEHDVELFLVPFELRPELAPEGVPITALGDVHSDRVREHMARMASEGGLELAFPDFVPNTHFAIAASEFARDRGPVIHERVHEAILAAYSGQADDIGNLGVLSEVISEAGLESTSVLSAIAEGRFDERIHQFTHLAMEMGVNATPAALICNELLIGSRPYRVLSEALAKCIVTAADLDTGQASDGG